LVLLSAEADYDPCPSQCTYLVFIWSDMWGELYEQINCNRRRLKGRGMRLVREYTGHTNVQNTARYMERSLPWHLGPARDMKTIWVLITLSTVHQVGQPLPTFDTQVACGLELSLRASAELTRIMSEAFARGEHPTLNEVVRDKVMPNYECRKIEVPN
jgi:hypothetical protein